MAAVTHPAHPQYRIAAVVGVLAAVAVAWAPFEGSSRTPGKRAFAIALGMCLAPVVCALIFGTSHTAAIATGLVIAGFFVFLTGLAAALHRRFRSPALAMILAGTVGALAVGSFHVGDPILEWGGAGVPSHFAISVLSWVNPLCGAVGDGHGLDWLRMPIMYSGFPGSMGGGLSSAQYYDFSYPPFWMQALVFTLFGWAFLVVPLASSPPGVFAGGFLLFAAPPGSSDRVQWREMRAKIRPVTEKEADSSMTVTGLECPMNYVRVKLRLETLTDGQVLEALVDDGEAAQNVPRSARDEGHEVLLAEPHGAGVVRVLIRKREVDGVA